MMRSSPPSDLRPQKTDFLVSFLVDARGGARTGARRSGVRMVIPPQAAEQPVRLTLRQLRPEQVLYLPPLSEGEGLASRIIQVTPASFLSPVLLEVPHFASLDPNREIVVLRSENGKKWSLHSNTGDTDNQSLNAFLNTSINNLNNNTEEAEVAHSTITTRTLPQFLAVVSRPRQELHMMGPEGGDIVSSLTAAVQVHFPARALTKEISVGLSVFPVPASELGTQAGAASPVVTVEPRRRKFHRPITVTMPLPVTTGSRHTANIETSLLLLCSMSGSGTRCVWEDVTLSTPLVTTDTTAQFTTVVSAQFWLLRLPTWMTVDKIALADNIFKLASRTPYSAQFWLYWRHSDSEVDTEAEMELRMIAATEGERVTDTNLEEKENFTRLYVSDKMVFLDRCEISLKITGNLETLSDNSAQSKLIFRPFAENRITIPLKKCHPDSPPVGKLEIVNDSEALLHSMALVFKPKKV